MDWIRRRGWVWIAATSLSVAIGCSSSEADPSASEGAPEDASSTGSDDSQGADLGPHQDQRPLLLPPLQPCDTGAPVPDTVRVLDWNIASGRVSSLQTVQSELASIDADVVIVQEVDLVVRRTGNVDQPRVLADALGYEYAFAASIEYDGGDFGLLILSRLPFSRANRISLDSQGGSEVRIAFDVEVCAGARPLRLVDMHADYIPEVNVRNLSELARILGDATDAPTVVAGDFNATPATEGVQAFVARGFVDVFETWDRGPTRNAKRIDYVFTNPTLAAAVVDAGRVETAASDHTPLWIDVALR